MYMDENIYVAMAGDKRLYLNPEMANRHGLIAGATGTGKTVTMKVMAESFSDMGVPVFMADVKGDVSGFAEPGENNEGMQKRIRRFGLESIFRYTSYPVAFWIMNGFVNMNLTKEEGPNEDCLKPRLVGLLMLISMVLLTSLENQKKNPLM